MDRRGTMDYFGALLRLAQMPARLLAGGEQDVLRQALLEYRQLKTTLAGEYVPPMRRTDIARLAGALYTAVLRASFCGGTDAGGDGPVRCALADQARSVQALVEAMPRFRKTDAFRSLLQSADETHLHLAGTLVSSQGEMAFAQWQCFASCAEALWQAGETAESILIKYA